MGSNLQIGDKMVKVLANRHKDQVDIAVTSYQWLNGLHNCTAWLYSYRVSMDR